MNSVWKKHQAAQTVLQNNQKKIKKTGKYFAALLPKHPEKQHMEKSENRRK